MGIYYDLTPPPLFFIFSMGGLQQPQLRGSRTKVSTLFKAEYPLSRGVRSAVEYCRFYCFPSLLPPPPITSLIYLPTLYRNDVRWVGGFVKAVGEVGGEGGCSGIVGTSKRRLRPGPRTLGEAGAGIQMSVVDWRIKISVSHILLCPTPPFSGYSSLITAWYSYHNVYHR